MEEITNPFERTSYLNRQNELDYNNPQINGISSSINSIKKVIDENDYSKFDINFAFYIFNSDCFTFNINILRNQYEIKYENSQNDYKKITKIKDNYEEKYKYTYIETDRILLNNLEKLLNFIEKIKENLKKEFLNEFELKINLKMKVDKNNEEGLYKNSKIIDCRYQKDNSDLNENELFEDKNILINGPGKGFENFMNSLKNKLKLNLSTINESIDKINKSGLNDFINIIENIDSIINSFDYTYNSLFSEQFINQFNSHLKEQEKMKSNSKDQINRALIETNINESSSLNSKQENQLLKEKGNSKINTSHFLKEAIDTNLSDIIDDIHKILKKSKISLEVTKYNGQFFFKYGRIEFVTGSITPILSEIIIRKDYQFALFF